MSVLRRKIIFMKIRRHASLLLPLTVSLLFLNCMAQDYVFNDGYRVGGNVVRNVGKVVLKNTMSGETATVTGNGSFIFSKTMDDGDGYNIVKEQDPVDQTCTVYNGSGTVSGGDVSNVGVVCSTLGKRSVYGPDDIGNPSPDIEFTGSSFSRVTQIRSLNLDIANPADVLITFTTNINYIDTFANARVRLVVDGVPVSQARLANLNAASDYPVNFAVIRRLQAGTHEIAVEFSVSSGTAHIVAAKAKTVLAAVVLDTSSNYISSHMSSAAGAASTIATANTWEDIPGLSPVAANYALNTRLLSLYTPSELYKDKFDYSLELGFFLDAAPLDFARLESYVNNANVSMILHGIKVVTGASTSLSAKWRSNTSGTVISTSNDMPSTLSLAAFGTSTGYTSSSLTVDQTIADTNPTNIGALNTSYSANDPWMLVMFSANSTRSANAGEVEYRVNITDGVTVITVPNHAYLSGAGATKEAPLSIITVEPATMGVSYSVQVQVTATAPPITIPQGATLNIIGL
jgi:hypothetical protein